MASPSAITVKHILRPQGSKTYSTGDISAECTVTVIGKPVESISFDTYSLEMEPGDTYYIITMISPGDADDRTLIWSSSDENVATVSDGTVTAIAPGSAEITASCGTAYATCYVTVNESAQPGSAQIGDFYYSDGTWSPQLDNSKTLIGIVFYVGDPAKDDAMLRADYPGCTHGLAVSIVEFTGPWQSNYDSYGKLIDDWVAGNLSGYESLIAHYGYAPDDNLNKMLGYNNTKAIKAFNNDPQNASWPVDCEEHRHVQCRLSCSRIQQRMVSAVDERSLPADNRGIRNKCLRHHVRYHQCI